MKINCRKCGESLQVDQQSPDENEGYCNSCHCWTIKLGSDLVGSGTYLAYLVRNYSRVAK